MGKKKKITILKLHGKKNNVESKKVLRIGEPHRPCKTRCGLYWRGEKGRDGKGETVKSKLKIYS